MKHLFSLLPLNFCDFLLNSMKILFNLVARRETVKNLITKWIEYNEKGFLCFFIHSSVLV